MVPVVPFLEPQKEDVPLAVEQKPALRAEQTDKLARQAEAVVGVARVVLAAVVEGRRRPTDGRHREPETPAIADTPEPPLLYPTVARAGRRRAPCVF